MTCILMRKVQVAIFAWGVHGVLYKSISYIRESLGHEDPESGFVDSMGDRET